MLSLQAYFRIVDKNLLQFRRVWHKWRSFIISYNVVHFRWLVDLQQEVFVTIVKITNRADCCSENLVNFDIRVGTNETDGGKLNPQCGPTYIYNVGAGETLTIKCSPPLLGRYLSISIKKTSGTLNFCELEVYGYQRKWYW